MTHPDLHQDILDSATPEELADLYGVLGEIAAEDASGPEPGTDYGPWDDLADLGDGYPATSPELAYELDEAAALELAGDDPLAAIQDAQLARVLDMTRADEDAEDAERAAGPRHRRYSSEERLSRALQRIGQGTYLPAADLSNTSGVRAQLRPVRPVRSPVSRGGLRIRAAGQLGYG